MKPMLLASDHAGFPLKEKLKAYLQKIGLQALDLGTYCRKRCDYPWLAYKLAEQISRGKYERGVLICKSGIGNSIVANRLKGVRAALCYNVRAARLSRQHNDSNVLVLGAAFVNAGLARRILKAWMNTAFLGGRHSRRLNQIKSIEKRIVRRS
jgi:ribose 5-phosphate isomerase B